MKTFYYVDELRDDFAGTDINTKKISGDYQYLSRNPLRKAFAWFLHHIIAAPIVFLYNQIGHGERIVGRKKLKPYRKTGYFMYGNHTRAAGDGYEPSLASFPRKAYIIAGPDAVSIPGVRRIVQDLGAIPLPSDTASARNFHEALRELSEKGFPVAIYPEAHIWPYYTKIRPFPDTSFAYPVECGVPSFCFVNTYHKSRFLKRPKMITYIDGPFFPPEEGETKTKKKALRDAVYSRMTELAGHSDVELIRYVKREVNDG